MELSLMIYRFEGRQHTMTGENTASEVKVRQATPEEIARYFANVHPIAGAKKKTQFSKSKFLEPHDFIDRSGKRHTLQGNVHYKGRKLQ